MASLYCPCCFLLVAFYLLLSVHFFHLFLNATAERKSDRAAFTHGKELLQAISLGLSQFEVYENRTRTADMINLNDYEEMVTTFLYDSHTSYSLLSDPSMYINLDDPKHLASFGTIRELSDSHVIQCGHSKLVADGTFLVGSSQGSWALEPSVAHEIARSMAHLHPDHLVERKEKGLTMIRVVVRTEEYRIDIDNADSYDGTGAEMCSKLLTESIHPLELFSRMRLKTITESPFQHIYRQRDTATDELSSQSSSHLRKEMSAIVTPDLPIIACTGKSAGYVVQGKGDTYAYELGGLAGCAEYSADVPGSFNFNYDPPSGTKLCIMLHVMLCVC